MSDFVKDSIDEQIETLIDRHGLLHVLTTLELICAEKAEHIRHNWQDTALAREWQKASTACGNVARKVTV